MNIKVDNLFTVFFVYKIRWPWRLGPSSEDRFSVLIIGGVLLSSYCKFIDISGDFVQCVELNIIQKSELI